MNSDLRSYPGIPMSSIALWLGVMIVMVLIMVVIGGVTRLTGSGLSMVDWKPVTGFLPPLNETQWQAVFALYKASPEYLKVNSYMDLDQFKGIFWLEYIHRVWGRMIGLVFLIPLFKSIRYRIVNKVLPFKLFGIWILICLQGVMGWYMVKSGLINDPHVSPFRLAIHLLLAVFILWSLVWTRNSTAQIKNSVVRSKPLALLTLFSILVTIFYGALVAGLNAGLVYNTFPLMGESILPDDALYNLPVWSNFFENPVMVQFVHRVLALTTFTFVTLLAFDKMRNQNESKWPMLLLGLASLQVGLGIATLLLHVPISLAAMHQAIGILLFTVLVHIVYRDLVKQ